MASTLKGLCIAVVFAMLLLFGIHSLLRADERSLRTSQPLLIEQCRQMGGEAILTYDSGYGIFILTGCKVR